MLHSGTDVAEPTQFDHVFRVFQQAVILYAPSILRQVLLEDMVDNSDLSSWLDFHPFLRFTDMCAHLPARSHGPPSRPDAYREGGQPHSQAQAMTSASSGRGSLSSSCTVQRRVVSPAAMAGVRCRYRRGRRFPPRSSGAGSTALNASCGRAK
jgi:hypothetical protein